MIDDTYPLTHYSCATRDLCERVELLTTNDAKVVLQKVLLQVTG